MKRPASLIMLLAAFLLSACGFHLRGAAFYDELPFDTVYVSFADTSLFGNELVRNLRASSKTRVVDNAKDAQVILDIMEEKKSKAFLSINVQGRAREYSLTYQVTFRLTDKQKGPLLAPTTIAASRTLIYNELVALGRESEENMLYRDMQSDLVQQVLRRMAALKNIKPAQDNAPGNTPPSPSKEPHAVAP